MQQGSKNPWVAQQQQIHNCKKNLSQDCQNYVSETKGEFF